MCLESRSICFAARDKYSGGIWRKRIAEILFPRWVLGWDTINSYVCFISKPPFVYRACPTPGLQFKRAVKPGLAWAHTSILTNSVWTATLSPPPPSPSRLAPAPCESHRGQSSYSSKLKTVRRRIFPSYSTGKRNTETFSLRLGPFWVVFFPLWGNTQKELNPARGNPISWATQPAAPAYFPFLLSIKTRRFEKAVTGT